MSGRIRSIKPELLEDAKTAGLSDSAFRIFIGMILLADDYGNLRAEAKYLEGQIYWTAVPEKGVKVSCKELETLVSFYEVRGQLYAHIKGWSKHQKVQHAGKPRVPAPSENDSGDPHETLTKVPETLTPDLRPPTSDHRPPSEGSSRDSHAKLKSIPPPPSDETPEAQAEEPEPVQPETGFDLAKRIFAEEWLAKYREPYNFDFLDAGPESENRVLQGLGGKAKERGEEAERWLRHVVRAYLHDRGHQDFLVRARHAAKFIRRSWQSYGNPTKPKPARASPPAEPVAPALSVEEQGRRAAEAMKAIGKIGMGGAR